MALEWKTVFIVLALICLCFVGIPIRVDKATVDVDAQKQFHEYMARFNKSYEPDSPEYAVRLASFQESLEQINRLNAERTSELSARYGVTRFSDLSREEFSLRHLQPSLHGRLMRSPHWRNNSHGHNRHHGRRVSRALDSLPLKVDWREKNVITGIKNQKTCGACWAFSTIETVETMNALKRGVLLNLSVQEMIDCARNGNLGCSGGDTCSLIEWMSLNKIRVQEEKQYPLTLETQACKLKIAGSGVQISPNFTCEYLVGNEEELLRKLAEHGPVVVAINALNWQNYLGGVIQFHCDGAPVHINHAVQIVGYDRSAPIPHYIVRNSWGAEFGDGGYLYIAIGGNLCGLATEVSTVSVV